MGTTAAIFYVSEGYSTAGTRLLGRQAAGEGFLKGLVRYGQAQTLYCYTEQQAGFEEFCDRVRPWLERPRDFQWLSSSHPPNLNQAGTLFYPSPGCEHLAWQRRFFDQRSYSFCGVTHTTATKSVMNAIGELAIAPLQPWDAVICTSNAVKETFDRVLNDWCEYLAQRIGSRPSIDIQLPVIPLGVDCDFFPQGEEAQQIRARLRQDLNIPIGAIAVLFVGRLVAYAKAHPVPMYLALERAAQQTRSPLYLIQAGWFETKGEEESFQNGARIFCPSVTTIFLDGRKPDIRRNIWCASDIFISLSDNVQETFGLTPVEAMAAGLPTVVSDWNGYKETVRDRVDGFRIPTLFSPAGCGEDLAAQFAADGIPYGKYIGLPALETAIDIDACASAISQLANHPELRQKMGENGRRRARETFDWKVVVAAYEALWHELAVLRSTAPMTAPLAEKSPENPLNQDLFRLFSNYPTHVLHDGIVFSLGANGNPEGMQKIAQLWMNVVDRDRHLKDELLAPVIQAIAAAGKISVGELRRQFASSDRIPNAIFDRTLVYLVKFDILKVVRYV